MPLHTRVIPQLFNISCPYISPATEPQPTYADLIRADCGGYSDGKADKVREMVYELSEAMYGIKREQEYMDVRERTHSASTSSPNTWCQFPANSLDLESTIAATSFRRVRRRLLMLSTRFLTCLWRCACFVNAAITNIVNTSTNSRVVYWSFFEAMILVIMSMGQVYYLNTFFEVRTVV